MTAPDPTAVLAAEQGIRSRTIELLRSLDQAQLDQTVPTCPAWTVAELACHMYGLGDDIVNGRLEDVGSDAWTEAQVARNASMPIDELCDAWQDSAATFDEVLLAIPAPTNAQIVMDLATHEHDIRLAIGQPGGQDPETLRIAAGFLLNGVTRQDPDVAAEIEGLNLSEFELLRSLTGRRSVAQLRAAGFPVDAYVAHIAAAPFSITTVDVVEVDLSEPPH